MRVLKLVVLLLALATAGTGLTACKSVGEAFQSLGRAID